MNIPVYNGTIFSSFFTDQNLTPISNKNELRSCDENPRDVLLSEPPQRLMGLLFLDDSYFCCGATCAAALYVYSLLKSAYGGSNIVCWVRLVRHKTCSPQSMFVWASSSNVIVCYSIDHNN